MTILAIDQGTTSSRALVFDDDLRVVAQAQLELTQYFPASGWVEHDPDEIWATVAAVTRGAIEKAGNPHIDAIGITNQRETAVIWDRRTGRPIHRAIVWQDRRTADRCAQLRAEGHERVVNTTTGLLLDPYFSATKIAWVLDHVADARAAAERGDLLFGTVDSWLIWKLTNGASHLTDATNAARTLLYDLERGDWSDEMCALFRVPRAMLPQIRDCAGDFGSTRPDLFGRAIPISGVAGDQQAATVGQGCFVPGMMKATYGTGCFALINTGDRPVRSGHRLLTTLAYRLDGQSTYALEGSIFVAGAVVQWLRDGLGLIGSAAESEPMARRADPAQDVVIVPAFTGLGAPHWRPESRGAIFGLTRATGPAELARAALESVGYQTRDLFEAMRADGAAAEGAVLRVDGGMSASDWTMQFLADILGVPVDRPQMTEVTAMGAAYLAGLGAGLFPPPDARADHWALDHRFTPQMEPAAREARYARWQQAVAATL